MTAPTSTRRRAEGGGEAALMNECEHERISWHNNLAVQSP